MPTLHLPAIHGNAIAGQTYPHGMTELAWLFATGWLALLGEDANEVRGDARMVKAAQLQAEWLAINDFDPRDMHLGANGSTANERLRAQGVRLPGFWPRKDNQGESVLRTWVDPLEAAAELASFASHRPHLTRQGFFRDHVLWGVGGAMAQLDRGGVFYVLCTAPREA